MDALRILIRLLIGLRNLYWVSCTASMTMGFRLFFFWSTFSASCRKCCSDLFASSASSLLSPNESWYLTLQPLQTLQLCRYPIKFIDIFTLLQQGILFCNHGLNFFNIIIIDGSSSDSRIASICSCKVSLTFGLFWELICSFRKDILSSIICCRLSIYYAVKPRSNWMVIWGLAPWWERVYFLSLFSVVEI